MYQSLHVSVVIPAKDEALSISTLIQQIKMQVDDYGKPIVDQIVVCDNGSKDDTGSIACKFGATVVLENKKGYGFACKRALKEIQFSDVVVFIDGDCAYDPKEIITLLKPFTNHADLVIGSRELGEIEFDAMPWHQIFGNKLAAALINIIWGTSITDLGPYRAISTNALSEMKMNSNTFGWTVEMQVKAILLNQTMAEVPVYMKKRIGKSKISGTLKGSILACIGIFGTIFILWFKNIKTNFYNPLMYLK